MLIHLSIVQLLYCVKCTSAFTRCHTVNSKQMKIHNRHNRKHLSTFLMFSGNRLFYLFGYWQHFAWYTLAHSYPCEFCAVANSLIFKWYEFYSLNQITPLYLDYLWCWQIFATLVYCWNREIVIYNFCLITAKWM